MAYNKFPYVEISGYDDKVFDNYNNIGKHLKSKLSKKKNVIAIETYSCVRVDEIINGLGANINFDKIIIADDQSKDKETIDSIIQRNLTDDRVFGVMSHHKLIEFFDENKINDVNKTISDMCEGTVLIIGVGASLYKNIDILIYADIARWEIQQRYRTHEFGNWKADNNDEDILKKYKRGYFIEWRILDRHKQSLFSKVGYFLDTNKKDNPILIEKTAYFKGLEHCVTRPFRVVPFFDAGVWGGQWMKEKFDLDKNSSNYAWCFDCVPEENSLLLKYGDIIIETPSINLVFFEPIKLLGEQVYARFGKEFPIRFDYLDTLGGQNLSLQVHPTTEYIQQEFGMHYTQDESYYIMECKEGSSVYLGLKDSSLKEEFIENLGNDNFDAEKYVNKIPAKKHDHFLIPAGTIHCSGKDTVVLEISATPYIFTFKLWDWGRVGLDGLPRPIHSEHGKKVIDYNRDKEYVYNNLVNNITKISKSDSILEEKTGLHQREFIETRRHKFSETVEHETNDSVNVICLVEGESVIVESCNNEFESFLVSYGETFIIPENIKKYKISPYVKGENKECITLKAYVRV